MAATASIVLITDGTFVAYAPEVYLCEERARIEAERWAWNLAVAASQRIVVPFDGRWQVGDRDVRLVSQPWTPVADAQPWVGTYWTEDGYPDPEAILLWGYEDARTWVLEPPHGMTGPAELVEERWVLAALYPRDDQESCAVVHLAKLIR